MSFSGNAPPTPGGAGAAPRSIGALGSFPLLELRPPWRLEEAPDPPRCSWAAGFSCRSVSKTASGAFFRRVRPGSEMAGQNGQNGRFCDITKRPGFLEYQFSGAICAVPVALGGPLGPIWVPCSSACSNMAENLRYQRKCCHFGVLAARQKTHKKAGFFAVA